MWIGCSYWCADSSPGHQTSPVGTFHVATVFSVLELQYGLCRGRDGLVKLTLLSLQHALWCSSYHFLSQEPCFSHRAPQVFGDLIHSRLCAFSLSPHKTKLNKGQGCVFPLYHPVNSAETDHGTLSDQYKIIDYVGVNGVILLMSCPIVVIINIKHLLKIIYSYATLCVYTNKIFRESISNKCSNHSNQQQMNLKLHKEYKENFGYV